jgi:DNA-binding GntR family transcriptional regulator
MERVVLAIERKHPKRAANAMEKHLVMVRSIFMEAAETLIEPAVDAGADAAA